jgi:hypothetical protein
MTPDQAAFLLTVFIGEAKRESLTTLRVLLAVPADKGGLPPASEFLQRSGTRLASRFLGTLVSGRIPERKIRNGR